jgi:hypothetical protein
LLAIADEKWDRIHLVPTMFNPFRSVRFLCQRRSASTRSSALRATTRMGSQTGAYGGA